jgi:putative flavoprotein involved in K+ transport
LRTSDAVDVVIIGAGQAGLAVGYYLRRTGLSFVILDAQPQPGGAWQHGWDSLHLFSPAQWNSLPGWLMPATRGEYPTRDEVIGYLAAYELRYDLPVRRPMRALAVQRGEGGLLVETDAGSWTASTLVSATGTWERPWISHYPGQDRFRGVQLHSATYRSPDGFRGQRVLVVGGGNSGAQIVADLAPVAHVVWSTLQPPSFLPDEVDGRYLFERATARYRALQEGRDEGPPVSLGNIVRVPPVRAALASGALKSAGPIAGFTESGVVWADGAVQPLDAVIWCTGFLAALDHLAPLRLKGPDGRIAIEGTRSVVEPRLWLVGYGDWTGFASATLIGVGRSARSTVQEIAAFLGSEEVPF